MTPVRAPVITRLLPQKTSSDERGKAEDDPRPCFPVAGAGPVRSGQDLTGSAVLADAALLLSHRDHEAGCADAAAARPW